MARTGRRNEAGKPLSWILAIGISFVASLFVSGLVLLIILNMLEPSTSKNFRDVGVLFAATIAAAGAITASFIAFSTSQRIESAKDALERARHVDDERTRAEAALVTLGVVATQLDGLYRGVRDRLDRLKSVAKTRDLDRCLVEVAKLESVPDNFQLLQQMDVRFFRLREQEAVRSIQVDLQLLDDAVDDLKAHFGPSKETAEEIIKSAGPDLIFETFEDRIDRAEGRAKSLFHELVHYINQRGSDVIPDERKLNMLLGYGASQVQQDEPIASLGQAAEAIRAIASDLLRKHVAPNDLREILKAAADKIRDEDAVPHSTKP
jgi:hypothetical protein